MGPRSGCAARRGARVGVVLAAGPLPRDARRGNVGCVTDHDDKRTDQLTTAPKATDEDADPRIDVSEGREGRTRIDLRDDAAVRPGADPEDR